MKGPFTRFVLACALVGLPMIAGCPTNQDDASFDPEEIALVRVEPADGEADVDRNAIVRITFSQQPLPESIDDQSVKVRTGGTFQTRPEGSFLVNGNICEFDPTVTETGDSNSLGFPAGSQISVEVPLFAPGTKEPKENFVQNIEGNPLTVASGDSKIAFTTGSGWRDPVVGPPGVIGLSFIPSPNALGQVPSHAAVVLQFTEAIDPSSIILGKNIFLTNNTDTAPSYQQDIPSVTFFDGSLTKYTFQPVFGFGQGPFNIKLNFIDPDKPTSFNPVNLPTDLVGNRVQNFTFLSTFDTQFDPSAQNTNLIREDFTSFTNRDAANTDALWGDDPTFPFNLVSLPVTNRVVNFNIALMTNTLGATTVLPNNKPLGMGGPNPEGKYCPTIGSLPGVGVPIPVGSPPSSAGRRQMNLYRALGLGGSGTIIRVAWGPDSDAIFAATYPQCIVRLGHKQKSTNLTSGSFFGQFDVDGYVVVADVENYKVGQASDVNNDGQLNTGYYNWPALETYFDFNGSDDLLMDAEASEGTTWQQFRTFMAFDNPFGTCNCFSFFGCNPNNSTGQTQMDTTFGDDQPNPTPIPGTVFNPIAFLNVQQFELAKLRSQGQTRYRNSGTNDPDYLAPIVAPLVQSGGATVTLVYSGSSDGIVEDVPFTSNINAVDGHRYIRWRAILFSNIFTKARARIALIEIPYTF